MIPHQVTRGTRHCDPTRQEPFLQLSQVLFPTAIGERYQRMHEHATLDGIDQCAFDLRPVKTEDHYFNALLGLPDAFYQAFGTVPWLDYELQSLPSRHLDAAYPDHENTRIVSCSCNPDCRIGNSEYSPGSEQD